MRCVCHIFHKCTPAYACVESTTKAYKHQIKTIMALFKVSIKQSGQYNGCKVEKGMEVEVSFDRGSNNLTGSIQGQEIIIAAFQRKYGLNIKPIMGA